MSTLIYGPVIPGLYNASYYSFFSTQRFTSISPSPLLHTSPPPPRKIYCLSLADDKYYIERTDCIDKRLSLHKEKKACAWTTLHEVIDVVEIIDMRASSGSENVRGDERDAEREVVERYMKQYGLDNVRGGSLSSVKLTDRDYRRMRKKLA